MTRLLALALLALSIATAKDWQECRVRSGARVVTQSQNNTVNVGHRGLAGIIADSRANRDKKVWFYVVDAATQSYEVESKAALDIDIDMPTKYARKGDVFYIVDRAGKERALRIVSQRGMR